MAARFSPARMVAVTVAFGLVAALCAAVALAFGEQPLSWSGLTSPGSNEETIFWAVRLPRVSLAVLVGAALAAAGSTLQTLLRNPLADPFVLGVSGGAALGATVALALGIGSEVTVPGLSATSLFALVGAVGATGLVLLVGRMSAGPTTHATVLAGVTFNAFALAGVIFIKALVAPDRLSGILLWLAGQLSTPQQPEALLVTTTLVTASVVALTALAPRMNVLALGDEDAQTLGVDVRRTRWMLLLIASMAVAAAVSLSGLIGFVGLLVPHLARLLVGPDQRLALPASALLGAAFLTVADLVARLTSRVIHTDPPVGLFTALLGAPMFLFLMVRIARRRLVE